MDNGGPLTIDDVAIVPVVRSTQQDIAPLAVQPGAIATEWIQYDPQPTSQWAQTRTGSGGSLTITPHDQSVLTPGFSLGDGGVVAKYLKDGRFVKLKVRFTVGAATKINGLVLDQSFNPGEVYGETGVMHIKLPFPTAATTPYFYGAYGFSTTAVTSGPVLSHQAQGASQVIDLPLVGGGSDVNLGSLWEFAFSSPFTFSSNTLLQRGISPGDFFDVQLEYETDLDD